MTAQVNRRLLQLEEDTTPSTPPSGFGAFFIDSADGDPKFIDDAGNITPLGGGGASPTTTPGDLIVRGATQDERLAIGSSGQVLTVSGGTAAWATPAAAGVTSVGLSLPAPFTITNSPVTSTGTLTAKANRPLFAPGGRLTLTTATPITTTDVTAATTLYYTPHEHASIFLYDGTSAWDWMQLSEISIAIPATTNTNYDVFVYNNSGTPTLELTAWTNATTRATALTRQDGVLVRSGATTRLYVGTIRTTGTSGQCADSRLRRFVWNAYHQEPRRLWVFESATSWTTSSTTFESLNGSTANRVEFVLGQAAPVYLHHQAIVGSGPNTRIGIALDATNRTDATIRGTALAAGIGNAQGDSIYNEITAAGYHYLQLTQALAAAGTVTFFGTLAGGDGQTGATGWVRA